MTNLQVPPSRVIAGSEATLALPLGELSPKVTERVKTFRRIKQKNIGKTVDIPDENGYYITVARPTQG